MLKNTSQDLPSLPLSLSDTWFTDADVQISVMWCHVVYPLDPTDMAGPAEPAEESTDTLKLCPREQFLKLCKERAGEVLCSVHTLERERETIAFTEYTIS